VFDRKYPCTDAELNRNLLGAKSLPVDVYFVPRAGQFEEGMKAILATAENIKGAERETRPATPGPDVRVSRLRLRLLPSAFIFSSS
jgi:hypothetical protein